MSGMIGDFHTHILPGVDDGSKSPEQSLEMLQRMHQQGISRVVATPHFYANSDSPRRFYERREKAIHALQAVTRGQTLPQVIPGAEVHFFEGISDCEELSMLTIAGTSCLLVEMPLGHWSERMLRELQDLEHKRGITPIVAHIERYLPLVNPCALPKKLSEMPVLVQASGEFFRNRLTRPLALKLLSAERIHLLGSDCHDPIRRKPDLDEAAEIIRRRLGQEALERICRWENRVLENRLP